MTKRPMWGVEFRGSMKDAKPDILFSGWHAVVGSRGYYHGEPTRALLFVSRSQARSWCRAQHDKYRGRTDCCGQWRFRPVPVVETVRRVRGTTKS